MEIIKNAYTTRDLTKPEDWNNATQGVCESLPVMDWREPETGTEFAVSFWKPSAEELGLLNKGKCILLGVHGPTHPVVFVSAEGEAQ